jgi:ribosomal protein S21
MMPKVVRVRVELKQSGNSPEERERAYKNMLTAFNRKCKDCGIAPIYKQKEYYEKPSETRHKKKRAQKLERLKAKRQNNPRKK